MISKRHGSEAFALWARLVTRKPDAIITYDLNAGIAGPDGKPIGTFRTSTVQVDADGMVWEGVTIANAPGRPGSREGGAPVGFQARNSIWANL